MPAMARIGTVEKPTALAYLRTSSATNVGGDSDVRQRAAIERFAASAGYELVGEHYDAAVSGADPVETRPGFAAMLDRIEGDGVRVVLIEDASRFARSIVAQELGLLVMQARGVRVLTASGDDLTASDDPGRVMMRQVAGAFAEYEKTRLVQKLKGARDRKSTETGRRIEGRRGYRLHNPELVREVRRLARKSPLTGEARSLRQIADDLAALGHVNSKGQPFAANQVRRLLDRSPDR
jgi:DNA invertase Pin-like site-specific DNA recombinase